MSYEGETPRMNSDQCSNLVTVKTRKIAIVLSTTRQGVVQPKQTLIRICFIIAALLVASTIAISIAVIIKENTTEETVKTTMATAAATTTTTATTSCNLKFTTRTLYPVVPNPYLQPLSVIDVNGDKKPDIIITNYNTNNVGVRFNSGKGMFLPEKTYSTGPNSFPLALSVVDVNGDHKPDIIVSHNSGNNIGVLFNSGDGTFPSQISYPNRYTTHQPALTVVDVNSDNKPDIIVVNHNYNNVGVLFNSGNGTFLDQTMYSTGNASYSKFVSVVDVNRDNKPDIIVANSNANNVGVLLNSGNGTFLDQTIYPTGNNSYPIYVSVVDVNCDDKPDIIVANYNAKNIGVLLNSGNGTFLDQITYSTGYNSYPICVSVVDVNCDDKLDIIVANHQSNEIGIFLNSGNGTFLFQTSYPTDSHSNPTFVSVVDVSDDNKSDIIVKNGGMHDIGVWLAS